MIYMVFVISFPLKKGQLVSELHLNFIYIQTYKQLVQACLANGATPDSEQNQVSFIQYLRYNCIFVVIGQMRVIFAQGFGGLVRGPFCFHLGCEQ